MPTPKRRTQPPPPTVLTVSRFISQQHFFTTFTRNERNEKNYDAEAERLLKLELKKIRKDTHAYVLTQRERHWVSPSEGYSSTGYVYTAQFNPAT